MSTVAVNPQTSLESWVLDDKSVISYKFLARSLGLPLDVAKHALQAFVQANTGKVSAKYLVSGQTKNGRHEVRLVDENAIADLSSQYVKLVSVHVFCVSHISADPDTLLSMARTMESQLPSNKVLPVAIENKNVVFTPHTGYGLTTSKEPNTAFKSKSVNKPSSSSSSSMFGNTNTFKSASAVKRDNKFMKNKGKSSPKKASPFATSSSSSSSSGSASNAPKQSLFAQNVAASSSSSSSSSKSKPEPAAAVVTTTPDKQEETFEVAKLDPLPNDPVVVAASPDVVKTKMLDLDKLRKKNAPGVKNKKGGVLGGGALTSMFKKQAKKAEKEAEQAASQASQETDPDDGAVIKGFLDGSDSEEEEDVKKKEPELSIEEKMAKKLAAKKARQAVSKAKKKTKSKGLLDALSPDAKKKKKSKKKPALTEEEKEAQKAAKKAEKEAKKQAAKAKKPRDDDNDNDTNDKKKKKKRKTMTLSDSDSDPFASESEDPEQYQAEVSFFEDHVNVDDFEPEAGIVKFAVANPTKNDIFGAKTKMVEENYVDERGYMQTRWVKVEEAREAEPAAIPLTEARAVAANKKAKESPVKESPKPVKKAKKNDGSPATTMQSSSSSSGDDKKSKKKEKGLKSNVKRAKSAYLYYCAANRDRVKEENVGKEDFKNTDIMKLLGAEWGDLSPEDKKPFDELAAKDKERYAEEKAAEDKERGIEPVVKEPKVPKEKKAKKEKKESVPKKKKTQSNTLFNYIKK